MHFGGTCRTVEFAGDGSDLDERQSEYVFVLSGLPRHSQAPPPAAVRPPKRTLHRPDAASADDPSGRADINTPPPKHTKTGEHNGGERTSRSGGGAAPDSGHALCSNHQAGNVGAPRPPACGDGPLKTSPCTCGGRPPCDSVCGVCSKTVSGGSSEERPVCAPPNGGAHARGVGTIPAGTSPPRSPEQLRAMAIPDHGTAPCITRRVLKAVRVGTSDMSQRLDSAAESPGRSPVATGTHAYMTDQREAFSLWGRAVDVLFAQSAAAVDAETLAVDGGASVQRPCASCVVHAQHASALGTSHVPVAAPCEPFQRAVPAACAAPAASTAAAPPCPGEVTEQDSVLHAATATPEAGQQPGSSRACAAHAPCSNPGPLLAAVAPESSPPPPPAAPDQCEPASSEPEAVPTATPSDAPTAADPSSAPTLQPGAAAAASGAVPANAESSAVLAVRAVPAAAPAVVTASAHVSLDEGAATIAAAATPPAAPGLGAAAVPTPPAFPPTEAEQAAPDAPAAPSPSPASDRPATPAAHTPPSTDAATTMSCDSLVTAPASDVTTPPASSAVPAVPAETVAPAAHGAAGGSPPLAAAAAQVAQPSPPAARDVPFPPATHAAISTPLPAPTASRPPDPAAPESSAAPACSADAPRPSCVDTHASAEQQQGPPLQSTNHQQEPFTDDTAQCAACQSPCMPSIRMGACSWCTRCQRVYMACRAQHGASLHHVRAAVQALGRSAGEAALKQHVQQQLRSGCGAVTLRIAQSQAAITAARLRRSAPLPVTQTSVTRGPGAELEGQRITAAPASASRFRSADKSSPGLPAANACGGPNPRQEKSGDGIVCEARQGGETLQLPSTQLAMPGKLTDRETWVCEQPRWVHQRLRHLHKQITEYVQVRLTPFA